MKKTFFIFLSLILCVCCFMGCNITKNTKEDVANLFSQMKNDERTGQFFDGNFLSIDFDASKISSDGSDKGNLFDDVYDTYVSCSSDLFFGLIDRFDGKTALVVKDFSKKQIAKIYEKLESVYDSLKRLYEDKLVLENSDGTLHYKAVISNYNLLIERLFDLNSSFAEFYFVKNIGYYDFHIENLEDGTDGNIKDMMRFQLLNVSKISFYYDLKNFVPANPLSETNIENWYNKTEILKSFFDVANENLFLLKNNKLDEKIKNTAFGEKSVLETFQNMQDLKQKFFQEYENFKKNIKGFDVREYLNSTNKNAYLEQCSLQEKSCFKATKIFLEGYYKSFVDGIKNVNNYIV